MWWFLSCLPPSPQPQSIHLTIAVLQLLQLLPLQGLSPPQLRHHHTKINTLPPPPSEQIQQQKTPQPPSPHPPPRQEYTKEIIKLSDSINLNRCHYHQYKHYTTIPYHQHHNQHHHHHHYITTTISPPLPKNCNHHQHHHNHRYKKSCCGGNSCCKGGKCDCCRNAILKCMLGGRDGGASGIGGGWDGYVLVVMLA